MATPCASRRRCRGGKDEERHVTTHELHARIADGRTDLVWDFVAQGHPATFATGDGVHLIQWCAYYGDVSAVRFLLGEGETLSALGDDLGLNGAAFHGHWRLCEFLCEQGADVNTANANTGETPLHSALCTTRAWRTTSSCACCWRSGPIRLGPRFPASRPGHSCVTAARGARRRCIGPPPSGLSRRFSCCWQRVRLGTRRTPMVTPRSRGRAGTCDPTPSCDACCTTATPCIPRASRCGRRCSDDHTVRPDTGSWRAALLVWRPVALNVVAMKAVVARGLGISCRAAANQRAPAPPPPPSRPPASGSTAPACRDQVTTPHGSPRRELRAFCAVVVARVVDSSQRAGRIRGRHRTRAARRTGPVPTLSTPLA